MGARTAVRLLLSTSLLLSSAAEVPVKYDPSVSEAVTREKPWESLWFPGEKSRVRGTKRATDYMWMSEFNEMTEDVVELLLLDDDKQSPVQGVLGLMDSRNTAFLGCYHGLSVLPSTVLPQSMHFALKLPEFLGRQDNGGDWGVGLLQYDGYDTGTFEEPEWVDLTEDARLPSSPKYATLQVEGMVFSYEGKSGKLKEVKPEWNPKWGESVPLRSAQNNILLPHSAYIAVTKELEAGTGIRKLMSIGVKVKGLKEQLVLRRSALIHPDGSPALSPAPQGGGLVLGAPLFRAANVAFATNAKGYLSRIGFAYYRDDLSSTEEFRSSPIHVNQSSDPLNYCFVAEFGIGGRWGPVQRSLYFVPDTSHNKVIVASSEGGHTSLLRKPWVGSFRETVFVFLCLCPAFIYLVLRNAAQQQQQQQQQQQKQGVDVEMGQPRRSSPPRCGDGTKHASIASPPVSSVHHF